MHPISMALAGLLCSVFSNVNPSLPAIQNSQDLERLIQSEMKGKPSSEVVDDATFLRRVSLDLIGRQPTRVELKIFLEDTAAEKRVKAIDRLLDSPEFGKNWANYWSDTISYRVPPPELTFLTYTPLKKWLATQLNKNASWDQITRALLTANGKVKEKPEATFIGYHQGNSEKLASETARIFLGLQIQCAQCHDHKFDHWKRHQFHELAAFFARSQGKLGKVQDGTGTIVSDKGKGEHRMPDVANPRKKGPVMAPIFLNGKGLKIGASDKERRALLAKLITDPKNPWFAKAYVNRIWSRLMGSGFYEPVDNMAMHQEHRLPKVHRALAVYFVRSKFDIKDFFRLVMNTPSYQAELSIAERMSKNPKFVITNYKLRGDQVYDALAVAIGLPNYTPPKKKPTKEVRFPPPPKSTRDIINEKFGYDPSLPPEEVSRSMGQAMLLMNNKQIQAQINADPKSGTLLSKHLNRYKKDEEALVQLFQQVLSRKPKEREKQILLEHIQKVGDRGKAFEDILWSMINTAEFTSKR